MDTIILWNFQNFFNETGIIGDRTLHPPTLYLPAWQWV